MRKTDKTFVAFNSHFFVTPKFLIEQADKSKQSVVLNSLVKFIEIHPIKLKLVYLLLNRSIKSHWN